MSLVRLRVRRSAMACLVIMVFVGCEKSAPPVPAKPAVEADSGGAEAAPAASVDEPLAVLAGTTLHRLDVEGMHCQGCADTISKRVQTLPGVKEVRVSFARKTAWVLVEDGSATRSAQIEKAVADAGYKARPASAPASGPA